MRTRAEASRQRWAILGFAVAILVLSFVVLKSAYYQLVLTQVLLWAVLSLAWNLLSGYSGYFSFGHAVFWGLGAYTVALGMLYLDLTPWISVPFAALVGAVAGAIIGYPTFRLRGHYFALAMLAYPLAIVVVGVAPGLEIAASAREQRASRPLAVFALQCQQSGAPPLGGHARPFRRHELSWGTGKITQCLPANGRVGIEDPVQHRHWLRLANQWWVYGNS